MDVPFAWVDVFAQRALEGNPLALVPDADALTDDQMRAIAREFNQSETTFLVPPSRAGADHRLRSFTPAGAEVLGAGHNALGAWIWLAASGRLDAHREAFVQQIGDELLDVKIDSDSAGSARVSMAQSPPRFLGRFHDGHALASALGLPAEALAPGRGAEVASTGADHLLVPTTTPSAVDAARPDASALKTLLAQSGAEGCYLYTVDLEPESRVAAYARFFNPTVGIVEDPATGTAAGPLAALLVRDGIAREGAPIAIEQGRALGRPSIITLIVDDDVVTVIGTGIVVAEGHLRL